jgi:hypothetical protein
MAANLNILSHSITLYRIIMSHIFPLDEKISMPAALSLRRRTDISRIPTEFSSFEFSAQSPVWILRTTWRDDAYHVHGVYAKNVAVQKETAAAVKESRSPCHATTKTLTSRQPGRGGIHTKNPTPLQWRDCSQIVGRQTFFITQPWAH